MQIQKTTEFDACVLYFKIASVDKKLQLVTFFVLTFCHFKKKNINCINTRFTYLALCVRQSVTLCGTLLYMLFILLAYPERGFVGHKNKTIAGLLVFNPLWSSLSKGVQGDASYYLVFSYQNVGMHHAVLLLLTFNPVVHK